MAEVDNPYPRSSRVKDVLEENVDDGVYVEGGRAVATGHAWGWIVDGYRLFRKQIAMWVLLIVIFFALLFGLQLVPVLGQLGFILLMPVLVGGLLAGCKTIERGGELELAHLFSGFRRNSGQLALIGAIGVVLTLLAMIPLFMVSGIGLLAASAGDGAAALAFGAGALLAGLVSLALLVPINMALWFAPALVMLHNQSAPRAIGQSFRGCLKNIVPFVIYGVMIFMLAFVASIPLGLGWLVLAPVVLCSVYAAHRDIFFDR